MHRKGAQDAKRAKIFTKLQREIFVSARLQGPDPASNPRLRAAIIAARNANMPKDNIDRTIKRATGANTGDEYQEILYEGYGNGGVALIIETLTDNRNRTAGEVRAILSKNGGALGESNSVSFQFEHLGEIIYPRDVAGTEAIFEAAVEAGAQDVQSDEDGHVVLCAKEEFAQIRDSLENRFGAAQRSGLIWQPLTTVPVDEDNAQSLFKMIDTLEDNDDVQRVFSNFDISDEIMAKLTG